MEYTKGNPRDTIIQFQSRLSVNEVIKWNELCNAGAQLDIRKVAEEIEQKYFDESITNLNTDDEMFMQANLMVKKDIKGMSLTFERQNGLITTIHIYDSFELIEAIKKATA